MDHIDKRLATDARNSRFNCAVCASLGVARKMLNRYYTLTDMSEVYQIAMGTFVPHLPSVFYSDHRFAPHVVLHPHHKLAYLKNAQWEEEWMDTASEIV